jgi:hypothetical protein
MIVDYKNLLPKILQDTRWGQFAEAYQSLTDTIKEDKVYPILYQYDINEMSTTEMQYIAEMFGFPLSIYTGYSSTEDYLKKELLTIIKRILTKTTRTSYKYTFYIFNLLGDVYPLILQDDSSLSVYDTWWHDNENPGIINILDGADDNILYYVLYVTDTVFTKLDISLTTDMSTAIYDADPDAPFTDEGTLDMSDVAGGITIDPTTYLDDVLRTIIVCYRFLFAESATEFLSTYTLKAFHNDITFIKKKTEEIIFEPHLQIYAYSSYLARITDYTDYNYDNIATQTSICISNPTLSTISKIRFGTSGHTTVNNSITDVASYSFQLTSSEYEAITGETNPTYRKILHERCTMSNFSEIAIWNATNTCILYSKFPMIYFQAGKYHNIKLEFIIE